MPAVLTAGFYNYFFKSTANAAKVAELLNNAEPVDIQIGKGGDPDIYTQMKKKNYSADISLMMTKQTKPIPSAKAPSETTTENTACHKK